MFGILCNQKNERYVSKRTHAIFQSLNKGRNIPIIIFHLKNINLAEKTVRGNLVSGKKLLKTKSELPILIFNLAIHNTKSDIKILRRLMELEGVSLINISNRFNQRTIAEMLFSNNITGKYVLPYISFENENIGQSFLKESSCIIKPVRGSNLSRVIYVKPSEAGFDVYSGQTQSYYHSPDFDLNIYSDMRKDKWILLKTPELLTLNKRLYSARVYLQKGYIKDWEVLQMTMPEDRSINNSCTTGLDMASKQIINCINMFISDMFICFIDFVIDINGAAYILNFGGWDKNILSGKGNRNVQVKLCKKMLEYAETFIDIRRRGGDDVD